MSKKYFQAKILINFSKKNNDEGWLYEMHELGFNYRITDFQASLGIEQLKKSEKWRKQRRKDIKLLNNT